MVKLPGFEPADASLFDDGYVLEGDAHLHVAPTVAFAYLADIASWPHWYPRMKSAVWTSPEPRGLNSVREVAVMRRKMIQRVVEVDAPWRMTFTAVSGSSLGVKSYVEQFEITPVSEHSCMLRWRMGLEYRFLDVLASGVGSLIMGIHPFAGKLQRQVPDAFAKFIHAQATSPGA